MPETQNVESFDHTAQLETEYWEGIEKLHDLFDKILAK